MPVFEFTVSKDVKVEAPSKRAADLAMEHHYFQTGEVSVDMGALGEVVISWGETEPRITAKRERKAKKDKWPSPELLTGPKKNPPLKDAQSEVKDACYICGKDIEDGQPYEEIKKVDATLFVHSVCAAAGGAT